MSCNALSLCLPMQKARLLLFTSSVCLQIPVMQASQPAVDPRYDWRNPDPARARDILKNDLKLNDEQLAAACADHRHPKLIIAGA